MAPHTLPSIIHLNPHLTPPSTPLLPFRTTLLCPPHSRLDQQLACVVFKCVFIAATHLLEFGRFFGLWDQPLFPTTLGWRARVEGIGGTAYVHVL